MKQLAALLFAFGSVTALAQTPSAEPGAATRVTSLIDNFFHGDFFNASAFVDGIYDTTQQAVNSPSSGGAGFDVGGSVIGSKTFSDALLSFGYRGEYRDYAPSFGGKGSNQNLNFLYTKRLSTRWTISFNANAGETLYGSSSYSFNPSEGALNNPLSTSSRFLSSAITLGYRQTQRLTYTFTGNFFLDRYTYSGATGVTGGIFSGSALYQLTARTSVGATYSHDEIKYQYGAGNSEIDGVFLSLTHNFAQGWLANVSAGATRVHTAGNFRLPVQVVLDGQTISAIEIIPYNTTSVIPTVQAGLSKRIGQFTLTANVSRGVSPGNGTYLTSSSTSLRGLVSRNFGHTSILTFAAGYTQLQSIAKTLSQGYSQDNLTVHYSRILFPHISAFTSYSYLRYGGLVGFGARDDNRFTFGVAVSTKSVPMTLF